MRWWAVSRHRLKKGCNDDGDGGDEDDDDKINGTSDGDISR